MLQLLLDPSVNAKAWYLWCFASLVAVGPYLNVFFQGRGLSKAQVGLIGALRPWSSAPASFAWAALADRLHAHRAVLLLTFTASSALRMLLLLPLGFSGLLGVVLAAEVLSAPVGVLADAAVMRICEKESDYGKYRLWGAVGWGTFSTVAGWMITHLGIRWAFYAQAVLAAPCLFHGARLFTPRRDAGGSGQAAFSGCATARPRDHKHHHRLNHAHGGQVGHREGSLGHYDQYDSLEYDNESKEADPLLPVRADIVDRYHVLHRTAPVAADAAEFAGAGGASGAAVVAAAGLQEAGASGDECKEHSGGAEGSGEAGQGGSYWRRLWVLVRRGEVLLFLVTATVMGYGFGTIDSFLFLYLEEMGASGMLMGLTLTITCAAEVPAFQLQDRLLDRWGVTAVLDLVQAVYALRLALYAALPAAGNVMWVLPIELLHGITFACGWGAGTVNCKLLAPPELAATLQGAFQGLYFGAGYGLGSLVGGWLGTMWGWQGMFLCAAATMLAFWVGTVAARRVLNKFRVKASALAGRDIELSTIAL